MLWLTVRNSLVTQIICRHTRGVVLTDVAITGVRLYLQNCDFEY